jgi:hypothetical protein
MITRILFSITILGLLAALLYRSYMKLTAFNPYGWKWYFANDIIQFVLYGGLVLFIFWIYPLMRKL